MDYKKPVGWTLVGAISLLSVAPPCLEELPFDINKLAVKRVYLQCPPDMLHTPSESISSQYMFVQATTSVNTITATSTTPYEFLRGV